MNKEKYAQIIDLPHHVSSSFPQMSMNDRAAQFAPFAALTGYASVISEAGRLTDKKVELDEEALTVLDRKLCILKEHVGEMPQVEFSFFSPDKRKSGGEYVTIRGVVKSIDEIERRITLADGTRVPVDDIIEIIID